MTITHISSSALMICFDLDDDLDDDDDELDDDDEFDDDDHRSDHDHDSDDDDDEHDEDDDDQETWQVSSRRNGLPLKRDTHLTSGPELPRLAEIFQLN